MLETITGKLCRLVPLKDSDAEYWARWYNDIHISMPESNVYDVFSLSNARGWVKANLDNNDIVYTIVENDGGKPAGKIELEADRVNRCGSFGILVGEWEFWGRGIGKEATLLLLNEAFNTLGLHNIMLGVYGFNKRAIALYQYLGFREIGRRREFQAIGGRRFDMILMDMLAPEFRGKIDGIL